MSDEFLESGLFESNAISYVEPFTGGLGPFGECSVNECSVCLGEHDEEIHAATLSVRGWFREEVTKSFRIQPEVLIETSERIVPGVGIADALGSALQH